MGIYIVIVVSVELRIVGIILWMEVFKSGSSVLFWDFFFLWYILFRIIIELFIICFIVIISFEMVKMLSVMFMVFKIVVVVNNEIGNEIVISNVDCIFWKKKNM